MLSLHRPLTHLRLTLFPSLDYEGATPTSLSWPPDPRLSPSPPPASLSCNLPDFHRRDAHQSLLATRMRTFDMVKAAPATAQVCRLGVEECEWAILENHTKYPLLT